MPGKQKILMTYVVMGKREHAMGTHIFVLHISVVHGLQA